MKLEGVAEHDAKTIPTINIRDVTNKYPLIIKINLTRSKVGSFTKSWKQSKTNIIGKA